MSAAVSEHTPGEPPADTFFGTLRYNIVCEYGHKAWSPNAVGYIGEGFRLCGFTRTGTPRVCGGKLRLL